MEFIANDQSSEGVQPIDRAFDFPSPAIETENLSVLGGRSNTASAVRKDEFDIAIGKSLSMWVAVGFLVVNVFVRNVEGNRRVGQRFNQIYLGMICRLDVDRPILCKANVLLAKDVVYLTRPSWSSLHTKRFQALRQTPSPDHWTKRRQQVTYDGNRDGKYFQRAPLRCIHRDLRSTPSR